jgi:aminoglycoside phosphotransferase (APT) family kinase protein
LLLPEETTSIRVHAVSWDRELAGHGWALDELHDEVALPACWEHGDFTPWNIRRLPDGRCALLDWENARRRSLPLLDAFHFLHMQDFLFGAPPRTHAKELWAKLGILPRSIRKLEVAYLAGAIVACAKSGNDDRKRFLQCSLDQVRVARA